MTDEHTEFLEDLRDSGVTNMFGAVPYLMDEFGVDKQEGKQILVEWIDSFKEDE